MAAVGAAMAVFFDEGTSADGSLEAVAKIRQIGGKQCFVSSMTAFVEDLKELAEKEEPIYVGLAVLLCCIILAIFMDSWMIPVVFMAGLVEQLRIDLVALRDELDLPQIDPDEHGWIGQPD